MKKPEKQTSGFAALYPTLASLIDDDRIWIEVGDTEMTSSFIRVLDIGGMIWEGEHRYKSIDDALQAAEEAVLAWHEENG
jgi:hypothetical protein